MGLVGKGIVVVMLWVFFILCRGSSSIGYAIHCVGLVGFGK